MVFASCGQRILCFNPRAATVFLLFCFGFFGVFCVLFLKQKHTDTEFKKIKLVHRWTNVGLCVHRDAGILPLNKNKSSFGVLIRVAVSIVAIFPQQFSSLL